MPVYQLIDQYVFPPPAFADSSGLLAVGGDLSLERLLLAYSTGVFPWFNENDPILWWSPDPRCILEPEDLKISRSLGKVLRRKTFEVSCDRAFLQVVQACADSPRGEVEGSWITPQMLEAYCRLHEKGYAHSIETWHQGRLVGGLYGVCLGRCFFGESMFHRESNASKVAFVSLVQALQRCNFELIDCQMPNSHLMSLGASTISRRKFLERLRRGAVSPSTMLPPGDFPADLFVSAPCG